MLRAGLGRRQPADDLTLRRLRDRLQVLEQRVAGHGRSAGDAQRRRLLAVRRIDQTRYVDHPAVVGQYQKAALGDQVGRPPELAAAQCDLLSGLRQRLDALAGRGHRHRDGLTLEPRDLQGVAARAGHRDPRQLLIVEPLEHRLHGLALGRIDEGRHLRGIAPAAIVDHLIGEALQPRLLRDEGQCSVRIKLDPTARRSRHRPDLQGIAIRIAGAGQGWNVDGGAFGRDDTDVARIRGAVRRRLGGKDTLLSALLVRHLHPIRDQPERHLAGAPPPVYQNITWSALIMSGIRLVNRGRIIVPTPRRHGRRQP